MIYEKGKENKLYWISYKGKGMDKPLVAVSKYPLTAKLEIDEKVKLYKKSKKN